MVFLIVKSNRAWINISPFAAVVSGVPPNINYDTNETILPHPDSLLKLSMACAVEQQLKCASPLVDPLEKKPHRLEAAGNSDRCGTSHKGWWNTTNIQSTEISDAPPDDEWPADNPGPSFLSIAGSRALRCSVL
ncbi:hypothetical protein HNY73_017667 [Argiope bruennichi]|uniref:Uncharacterized protein n=1 Tax=Argiope bruennichi TaxID=94029 RepID=A0A8T0EBG1_ARGBR|nr:hypothetical protein HNY73_017667 [Argiope bruennichi]